MTRERCLEALAAIAAMHNFNLTPAMVHFYNQEFERVGFEESYAGLTKLVRTAKKFPTIPDFLEAVGAKPPEEKDEAAALALKIWNLIAKGSHLQAQERAKRELGEFGWHVVEVLGGLSRLCDTLHDDDRGTFIAQTRDAIKGLRHSFNKNPALGAGSFDALKFIEEVRGDTNA